MKANIPVVVPIDFRPMSRDSDKCLTVVTLYPDWDTQNAIRWIHAGQTTLRKRQASRSGTSYDLTCNVRDRATDFEHSSAYIFILPLIGVTFSDMHYHRTTFQGWIDPNILPDDSMDAFHVPPFTYDPFKHEDSTKCTSCKGKEKHWIVPYLPSHNPTLYKAVKGMKVEIVVSPVFPDDE